MITKLALNLELKEVPVELRNGTSVIACRLVELTGAQRDLYMNFSSNAMAVAEDGRVVGVKDFTGLQTKLVSLSLRRVDGGMFTEDEVKAWPATAVEALYTAAREMNGLYGAEKETAETKAKND